MHYDMEDLLEQANEIQETLGRSYAVPDELDEADLQAGMSSRQKLSRILRKPLQNWTRSNSKPKTKAILI